MKMIYHSRLNKKGSLLPWVKYYERLLEQGRIDNKGGAYQRLKMLRNKYIALL
jgi:hypothetical protein